MASVWVGQGPFSATLAARTARPDRAFIKRLRPELASFAAGLVGGDGIFDHEHAEGTVRDDSVSGGVPIRVLDNA